MHRVLLVEDNMAARDMLVRRLERRGYSVVVASNGDEALELAGDEPAPDLILTELSLPGMDGWELARKLKADPQTRRMPIIALTVRALDEDREQALAAGFDDYDTKPVDLARLLGKMSSAIDNAEAAAAQPQDAAPSEARLLVLDDSAQNYSDSLVRRMRQRGYEVDVAADVTTAVALLDRWKVHLVIVDSQTRSGGLEALHAIRAIHSRGELPVVMVTERSDADDMVEALSMGANDYVTKPVEFEVLQARIEGLLKASMAVAAEKPGRTTRRVRRVEQGTTLEERYELGPELGRGGSATVFSATQLSTGQKVAVKVLLNFETGETASHATSSVQRFGREMEAIGRLRHPHIVRLIDSGKVEQVDGVMTQSVTIRPYLVMEMLEGEALSERLQAGEIPLEQTVDMMLPVISALCLAHDAGIVHRDIKPANIFLARGLGGRDRPVVLDFGIAKHVALPDEYQTGSLEGSFIGTPRYLAPEQADGSNRVAPYTDQYALAIVMLECLAGRSPLPSELSLIVMLDMIASGELPKPQELIPGLPDDLARTIERAMSISGNDRFPTMAHFGLALLPFASPAAQGSWAADFGARVGS